MKFNLEFFSFIDFLLRCIEVSLTFDDGTFPQSRNVFEYPWNYDYAIFRSLFIVHRCFIINIYFARKSFFFVRLLFLPFAALENNIKIYFFLIAFVLFLEVASHGVWHFLD